MIYSLIKKLLQFRRRAISADNPLDHVNVYIHESCVVSETKFAQWIKIQKQCFFYNSFIDSYTYFAGFNSVMNTRVGKFCSIGAFVSIGPGKHPIEYISTSPVFFSPQKQCGTTFADKSYYREMGKVEIGNDVWIGANAIIFDDIIIGHGAVIAAGAVVTKNVEPYSIVGGVPAKFIRKRFSDELIKKLLEFAWWDKDEEWLKKNYILFHDTNAFEKLFLE